MTNTPRLPLLQRPFFKNIAAPIVRGLIKQVPIIGTPVVELASTLTGHEKKHTALSQIVQWAIAGVVLADIILNKGENLKAIFSFVLEYLK